MTDYGPKLPISQEIMKDKYLLSGETFKEGMSRVASALTDNEEDYRSFREILLNQRFLPAGRVQTAIGAPRQTTPYNCYVSRTIDDSMKGITEALAEAAETMRLGGGIGYDFSTLRPKKDLIKSLDSKSSGPISFMGIFDALCKTISSAGHRRGAQMGVLRVDHPDIEEFIQAKTDIHTLTQFNISVGITDEFMKAVKEDAMFDLQFGGRVYRSVRAKYLWEKILRNTWDWAEPGVLFLDTMNKKNNLWYCETIAATNPCGEQPLPPYGACLLGSFNLTKYLYGSTLDIDLFKEDIPQVVEAMDNIIDIAIYPLEEQMKSAQDKRRMGLGLTGVANTIEAMGFSYGSPEFMEQLEAIMEIFRDEVYAASIDLARRKGSFPLFDCDAYLESGFAKTLPEGIREGIRAYGIRNSHLLSIAPTGTISLSADNISSGIEPPFSLTYNRKINTADGQKEEEVSDFAWREWGVKGKTALEIPVQTHVKVLALASRYVDSACSKTCNVGDDVTWEEFKDVYMQAYDSGCSGCTTFRASGKRAGILTASSAEETTEKEAEEVQDEFVEESGACYFDPLTGKKTCDM